MRDAITYQDEDEFDVQPPTRRRFWTSRRQALPPRDAQGQPLGHDAANQDEFDYIPTEEDFLPSPPKQRGPLNQRPDLRYARPAWTMLALFLIFSLLHWADPTDRRFAASYTQVLESREWWRLVSALFTHADLAHLAANTPLFLIFGWLLHAYFGWLAFPTTALLIGVVSNLATIYTMSPTVSLMGASGMLYGMVALWLVLYVHFDTDYNVPIRIFRAIGVSLLLLFPTTFYASTSYTAHAMGFLSGILAGFLLTKGVSVRISASYSAFKSQTEQSSSFQL